MLEAICVEAGAELLDNDIYYIILEGLGNTGNHGCADNEQEPYKNTMEVTCAIATGTECACAIGVWVYNVVTEDIWIEQGEYLIDGHQ